MRAVIEHVEQMSAAEKLRLMEYLLCVQCVTRNPDSPPPLTAADM